MKPTPHAHDPSLQDSLSIWAATTALPEFSSLTENYEAEVCVVGAGIAGLTTAYLLAKEGKHVAVLDDGTIGDGETMHSTAQLNTIHDDGWARMEAFHGVRGIRLCAQSYHSAIDLIAKIVRLETIDCSFERLPGYLMLSPDQNLEFLEKELQSIRNAGLMSPALLNRAPLQSFESGPCIEYPDQAQFHPGNYLKGLAAALSKLPNAAIFTHTHASKILEAKSPMVETKGGARVRAKYIVQATNVPIHERVALHTKLAPYRSYVIAAPIIKGSVINAQFWDTADPYHYVRTVKLPQGDEMLLVGGEDHKTGQESDAENRYEHLERWGRERFPGMQEIAYRWSGQTVETIDGMPYLGRAPGSETIFMITGDSGTGMTHGTIGGMVVSDLILGRTNPWVELYDPSRKSLYGIGRWVRENANVAVQYTDWLTSSDFDSEDEIRAGEGGVIRNGFTKLAVYRDECGDLHHFSAVCPHLGGIVRWNASEHTWDCPCHGSRFAVNGEVINGPAAHGLRKVDEEGRGMKVEKTTTVGPRASGKGKPPAPSAPDVNNIRRQ